MPVPDYYALVALLLLVAASNPNVLDVNVKLIVCHVVVYVAVDRALQHRTSVGVVFSDRSDSLDRAPPVAFTTNNRLSPLR